MVAGRVVPHQLTLSVCEIPFVPPLVRANTLSVNKTGAAMKE